MRGSSYTTEALPPIMEGCVLVGGIFRLAWDPQTGRQETILSESRIRFASFMAHVLDRLLLPGLEIPVGQYAPAMGEQCRLAVEAAA